MENLVYFFVTTSVPVVNSKSIHSLATMSPVRFAHLNGLQNQHRLHPDPRIDRGEGVAMVVELIRLNC